MLRELRRRVEILMHRVGDLERLEDNALANIAGDVVWIIQNCSVPKLRYYSIINGVLEVLSKVYMARKLDMVRDTLLTIVRRCLEEYLVIEVMPRAHATSYRFVPRRGYVDPKKVLDTVEELCSSFLGPNIDGLSIVSIRIAVAYIYTIAMIIFAGVRDGRRNIPRRLIKNINILLRQLIGNKKIRFVTFGEAIEQIAFHRHIWTRSKWRDFELISKTVYRINHAANMLIATIGHEAIGGININELCINGFHVDFKDGRINTKIALHRLLDMVEYIGRKIVTIIENSMPPRDMKISESTKTLINNIIGYIKSLTKHEIVNSLSHDFGEISKDLAEGSRLRRIITILLSLVLARQAIIVRLFPRGFEPYLLDTEESRGGEHILQIICIGNDAILKNILEFPIYHTDGHRYSALSRGCGALDVDLRASRIMVLRYMYPMNHGVISDIEAGGGPTLYDLYNRNISIPWIEFRISRIVSQRNGIYIRLRERNIYEGHIEFMIQQGYAGIWTPGRLTLMVFMLLTSPIYEKMIDDRVIIKELSIEVRYFGPQDTHDPLILPKLCNNILRLLQRAICGNIRKVIILTALAEEIRVRFLVRKDNKDIVIHMDILPLILRQPGRRIYGAPVSISDTLVEYMRKYRLELISYSDVENRV